MSAENIIKLANELKKYGKICYYPSSGRDLSDVDYFGSGKLLWSERIEKSADNNDIAAEIDDLPDLIRSTYAALSGACLACALL